MRSVVPRPYRQQVVNVLEGKLTWFGRPQPSVCVWLILIAISASLLACFAQSISGLAI